MGIVKDYQRRSSPSIIKEPKYRDVAMSFQTGEQGDINLYFNQRVRITKIRGIVTLALAATNSGTITPKNNAGTTMTGGVLTFAASAALGNEQEGAISANNIIEVGQKMTLTSAKAAAGGKVNVSVEYQAHY